jgi:dephospho-CoA kinase
MSPEPSDRCGKVIGIVGGVASGKSAVTQFLAELGGGVLNADKMAHEVLQQPRVINLLVNHFGSQILSIKTERERTGDEDVRVYRRSLDRSMIAKQVFGATEQHKINLQFLESVVQTRVRDRLLREIEAWRNGSGSKTFLVLDVPLLLERGWDRFCDYVLMIDTPDEMRKANAIRRGWTEQDWRARELSQMSVAEKRDRATHLIPNRSSLDNLRNEVQRWFEEHLV